MHFTSLSLARPPGVRAQRGGFLVGIIVGILIGLATALGVALYVTKVPVPFINKVPQRTAEQDAAESERNKNWDPNAPLAGKNPARPASVPASGTAQPGAPAVPPNLPGPSALPSTVSAAKPAASTAAAAEAFVYFVQAGAYARTDEAEAQRAKLAIRGFESRITEREQSGRTVYRVRIGPFNERADAEAAKDALAGVEIESALVRVQK
jgi:cell division protein FtsN